MSVSPGNYSPDNWSSGYRIRTVDSVDKRAELFNDFSYWMVRKFELEISTRENYDSELLSLINNNVSYSVTNRSRISSLDNQLQPLKKTVSSLNQYAITNRARISSLDNHLTEVENYGITNRSRISSLDNQLQPLKDTVTSLNDYAVTNRSRISNLDGQLQTLKEFAETNRGRITTLDTRLTASEILGLSSKSRIDNVDNRLVGIEASSLSHDVRIGQVDNRLTTAETDIVDLYSTLSANSSLMTNLFGVNTIASSASSADGVYTKLQKFLNNELKAQLVELRSVTEQTNTKLDTINSTLIDEIKAQLVMVRNNITALNATQLLANAAIKDSSNKNAENLTIINGTLKGLKNYDDTSFKKSIDAYFKSDSRNSSNGFEGGVLLEDGIVIKLIKGQFTRLIAELNRHLTLSFATTTNNIDSFKIYLREEFALLNDWASLQVDWSTMINDNILVAIAALDKILAKPVGNVNVEVPPSVFDFDRLKELLDGISFGNVINEAGTNIWDVLKELIEAMGKVVEAVVGIVPDLIDKLIALVIPENPNFFSEDVEALTSAFDMKFEWAFNLSDSFKSVFSQPKSLKTLTVPIGGKEYKVVPDVVDLNIIKTIFTGYFCFLTLFTSYKRIVGGGDVIQ